ncbi:Reverse transcriptase domain [Sesbania bispinosa]|nr:Reverse transcriptase domain [Sesbania bispinosa]
MDLFREFLHANELMDLETKGCRFTWSSNPRNGFITRERLDRVLVNWALRFMFEHAIATALPAISSDHSPIVLWHKPKLRGDNPFRYEAIWEEHVECAQVIEEGWSSSTTQEDVWEDFLKKAKNCKRSLKNWHQRTFKKADSQIVALKKELEALQNSDPASTNWNRIQFLKKEIDRFWKQKELYWAQRSRLKWLNHGDKTQGFFMLPQYNEGTRINFTGSGTVKDIYSTSHSNPSPECFLGFTPKVTTEMNEALTRDVTDIEIEDVVFSLGVMKAPGPDGLNGFFYQKHRQIVKQEVVNLVQDFFQKGIMRPEINETVVALVPKTLRPENVQQLRPISCCNYVYKIISKIIVKRLEPFMGQLISENQSAFVGGRQIQDNLAIAQEIFHWLKKKDRRASNGAVVKIDLAKAYDSPILTSLPGGNLSDVQNSPMLLQIIRTTDQPHQIWSYIWQTGSTIHKTQNNRYPKYARVGEPGKISWATGRLEQIQD